MRDAKWGWMPYPPPFPIKHKQAASIPESRPMSATAALLDRLGIAHLVAEGDIISRSPH
jgi:hypothetical protein